MTPPSRLQLEELSKRFGATHAVDRVSLEVQPGELVTLVGPSGSGKTTILRLIAGFIEPDHGKIFAGDEDMTPLPPERRDIGMVFQSYALFPHMDVTHNVSFGLDRRGVSGSEKRRRVQQILELVNLHDLDTRYPSELSGGQRQRVALARALVIEPRLLLLDEPLSNLDAQLRERLRDEIRSVQRRVGITTVLVTHDQEEALALSDRVAVLDDGRLHQMATPRELYDSPANQFVASFIGKMNWLPLNGLSLDSTSGLLVGRLASGETIRAPASSSRTPPSHGRLALRPEAISIDATSNATQLNRARATITKRTYLGTHEQWQLELNDGTTVLIERSAADHNALSSSPDKDAPDDNNVFISWRAESGKVFFDD